MRISSDVIRDLLPAYLTGDASADTRALVEEALTGNPDLRAEAGALETIPVADVTPPADLELSSLKRTQLLLRRRTFLVGFGYLFTTLPLALVGRAWGPVWFDVPVLRLLATACPIAAALGWLAFMRNARELCGTGLEPLRSRGPVWAWGFGCWWFASSAAVVVNDWFPGRLGAYHCAFLLLTIAFWVKGLRLRQFRTQFDVDRPQSLLNDATKHGEK